MDESPLPPNRTGTLCDPSPSVLPRSVCGRRGVRHHQGGVLYQGQVLGQGAAKARISVDGEGLDLAKQTSRQGKATPVPFFFFFSLSLSPPLSAQVKALVGNKSDLVEEREVSTDLAKEYADQNGMLYMETSAKTAENIHELFEAIAINLPRVSEEWQ